MSTRRFFCLAAASTLASLLVAGSRAVPAATAECLASDVRCQDENYAPTSPTFHSECTSPVMYWGNADYDVPAGTIRLGYNEWMWVAVSLRDEFTLTGPLHGTPITLHLRIRFHGSAGGYGSGPSAGGVVSARALDPLPGDADAQKDYGAPYGLSGTTTFSDSLDFFLARPAGSPVGIEIHADATYGYALDNQVQFEFLDLPPGSNVTSCKGYSQDEPVPALPVSWGHVKAAYR